jgi:hypothetical protein
MYIEEDLKKHPLAAARNMCGDDCFCFQQDGALSHTAKIPQKWCEENLIDFIPKDEWSPSSPALNPLDLSIWGYMKV